MNIEEAKKDYELIKRSLNKRRLCPCGYCNGDKCMPQDSECLKDDFAINTALDAIEKQIPKKISHNEYGYKQCPSCGGNHDCVMQDYCVPFNYCTNCGQRLDWGEYE